jgi:hypothetical protein
MFEEKENPNSQTPSHEVAIGYMDVFVTFVI